MFLGTASFTRCAFFFLMLRRPPRSTLFPYTRSSDLDPPAVHLQCDVAQQAQFAAQRDLPRSEEHTSELQSHVNLVCRLLLEKKKKSLVIGSTKINSTTTAAPLRAKPAQQTHAKTHQP